VQSAPGISRPLPPEGGRGRFRCASTKPGEGGSRIPARQTSTADSLHEFSLGVKHIPGVIEHGLFIEEADAVLVEGESDDDLEFYMREDEDEPGSESV